MFKLVIALSFGLAACGGNKQPAPSEPAAAPAEPAPSETPPMSPDECTSQGAQVRGDIGDGKVACAEGERDLGRVNQGIEGAVCCAPPAAQ